MVEPAAAYSYAATVSFRFWRASTYVGDTASHSPRIDHHDHLPCDSVRPESSTARWGLLVLTSMLNMASASLEPEGLLYLESVALEPKDWRAALMGTVSNGVVP